MLGPHMAMLAAKMRVLDAILPFLDTIKCILAPQKSFLDTVKCILESKKSILAKVLRILELHPDFLLTLI
jgi:hypothetical protein